MIINEPSQSGKTHLARRIISEQVCELPIKKVVWCYKIFQPWFYTEKSIKFVSGLPSADEKLDLLILDDLVNNLSSEISQMFTVESHHKNFNHTYEIKLEEGDLLQQINSKLLDVRLNDVKFSESNGQIIVTLPFNVNIEFKRDSCPKLMTALNIIDDAYVIREEQLKIQFFNTRPASSIKDESFNVIIYKVFPTTRKETKSETFFIPKRNVSPSKRLI
ncbi:uncharacterized protein TNIN_163271 [Trichonephila inaurata madagascariensis]|uniref:Uncharacterized protein n=1 Tax=Trichonephila inaurata madagascariensis TaxID=2747483 RepID=A0A8X6IF26_9ARAC|nr:uncharacterized protein TNIN_163271 [Trichonephila inaurata madagascariensis]